MSLTNYTNPGWVNGAAPAIDATNLNALSDAVETLDTTLTTVAADYAKNSDLAGKGSINTPVYIDNNGVAAAISSPLPVTLGGTGTTTASDALTALGAEPKANVTSKGNVTTPVYFDASGTANAITGPIPVSLGGTGAATASAALTALGAEPIANVTSKGSSVMPVYFDSDGVATALTVYSKNYTLTHSASGTKMIALKRVGSLVMATFSVIGTFPSASTTVTCGTIPDGYKPVVEAFGWYHCVVSATIESGIGIWQVQTDGGIVGITTSTSNAERRCTICWITTDDAPTS